MIERALDAGVPAAWATADSVYGDVKHLRVWLEARPSGDVLAVSGKDTSGRPTGGSGASAPIRPPHRRRAGSA